MIEQLFSSKIQFLILSVLFTDDHNVFSTPEIVEKTGKQQPNVAKELEQLICSGFVIKEKQGKQNYYKINLANPYVAILKTLFEQYTKEQEKYLLVNEEGNIALLTITMLIDGFAKIPDKNFILSQPLCGFTHYKNNYLWFYVEKQRWETLAKEGLNILQNNSEVVEKTILPLTEEWGREAYQLFFVLQNRHWDIPLEDTKMALTTFYRIASDQSHLNLIGILDLTGIYSDFVTRLIEKKIQRTAYTVASVMECLLQPPKKSWTQLLQLEMLREAQTQKTPILSKTVVDSFFQKWSWLNFGYRGPGLTRDFFEKTLEEIWKKTVQKREEEIIELEIYESRVREQKNQFWKVLPFTLKERSFIEALSLLSYLKVYRKDIAFLCFDAVIRLLKNHFPNFKKHQLFYLTPQETIDFFKDHTRISKEELAKRESESLLWFGKNNQLLTDSTKIISTIRQYAEEKKSIVSREQMSLLHGNTACLGKTGDWIYGTVKIVNHQEEMKKMQQGDILFSWPEEFQELLPQK